jgi:hypothetical protein
VFDGGEVGEDDFDLAAVAGVDDAGQGGEPAQGHAGTVFDQGAEAGGKGKREAGGDGDGFAGLERPGGDGMEVGGEIAEGAGVGVARKLGCGVQLLSLDDEGHNAVYLCPPTVVWNGGDRIGR